MEGQLSKWTNLMKGWQYRWFVLNAETGYLEYYVVRPSTLLYYFFAIFYVVDINMICVIKG